MNAFRSKALLAIILLVPVVLSGCGGAQGDPPTPKPTREIPISHEPAPLDGGWTLATVRKEGFAIGLPPGWITFDLSQNDLESAFAEMAQANPAMASALSGQIASMASQGIKLYAIENSSSYAATGFATNLNVIKEPVPDGMDLDQLSKQSLDETKKQLNLSQDIKFFKNRLNINSGEAERVQYTLNLNVPNGKTITASFSQYMAINGGNAYILTYTTTDAQFDQYSETFDKSARSLTFLANN
jgi:hypothetical protein